MADNSHEITSPVEASGGDGNQQHLFESALLVDPSHVSFPTPASSAQAEPISTSEPTSAEASLVPSAPSSEPAQASQGQPASVQRSNTTTSTRDPRHCWICLTDEGQDSTTNDWRSPCPCNLTAHEDCLLQWISETESTSRKDGLPRQKIQCPQCKAEIKVERPTEILVLLEELLAAVARQIMLPAGLFMLGGVVYSGSMVYGFNVLELIFGADGGRCLFAGVPPPYSGAGPLVSRAPAVLRKVFDLFDTTLGLMSPFMPKHKDSWLFWLSPWIAPTLLISRTGFADRVFGAASLPSLLVLGYNTMADPRHSPIFSWPPTPGLALLSLPYIRTLYLEGYNQLFAEHEKRWRLAIQRHPREGETAEEIAANDGMEDGVAVGDHVLGIEIELVQDEDEPNAEEVRQRQHELAIIQRQTHELLRQVEALRLIQRQQFEGIADGNQNQEGGADIAQLEAALDQAAVEPANRGAEVNADPRQNGVMPPAPAANAQANPPPAAAPAAAAQPNAWEFRQNVSIFAVARTVVATLLFPAASSVVGSLLVHTLPRTWVVKPSIPMSTGGFLAGLMTLWSGKKSNVAAGTWKKGLLQEKWGRTIVGGMIVVGVKDAVGLYVLWRRAKIEGQRRVCNYEGKDRRGRRDRGARSGAQTAQAQTAGQ